MDLDWTWGAKQRETRAIYARVQGTAGDNNQGQDRQQDTGGEIMGQKRWGN